MVDKPDLLKIFYELNEKVYKRRKEVELTTNELMEAYYLLYKVVFKKFSFNEQLVLSHSQERSVYRFAEQIGSYVYENMLDTFIEEVWGVVEECEDPWVVYYSISLLSCEIKKQALKKGDKETVRKLTKLEYDITSLEANI